MSQINSSLDARNVPRTIGCVRIVVQSRRSAFHKRERAQSIKG
jgi:hypothetical protein